MGTEPRHVQRWYGWQTLLTDGGALVLLATGAQSNDPNSTILEASLATYVLGGPVVHLAHGRLAPAGTSLLLRIGLPMGGLGLGLFAGGCSLDACSSPGTLVAGMAVGVISAIAVDAGVLSYEDVEVPASSVPASVRLAPLYDAKRRPAGLGLVGVF
jgi:hypothetical protein